MATKHVTLKGKAEWCKPWPGQIDREFEDPENGKGGNWSTIVILDDDSLKVFNALSAKTKLKDGNKLTLRRYERHPSLGELGPVKVTGVDEGIAIGNGSDVSVDVECYDYTFKGRPGRALRWVSLNVDKLVEYVKPDAAKPAVGIVPFE